MGVLKLSKSGKAVLLYGGDGCVQVTSVKFLQMLIDGNANGNMILLKTLRGASDHGLGSASNSGKPAHGKSVDFGGLS